MPPATRLRTGRALTVTIDDVPVPGVTGVSGVGVEYDAVEYREGSDPPGGVRRLPGRLHGGDATLTRALTKDLTFETWVRGPGAGAAPPRRDVRVRFFDRHGDPVRRYRLVGAWPRRLEVTGSTLADGGGLLELLVISYDACVPET